MAAAASTEMEEMTVSKMYKGLKGDLDVLKVEMNTSKTANDTNFKALNDSLSTLNLLFGSAFHYIYQCSSGINQ